MVQDRGVSIRFEGVGVAVPPSGSDTGGAGGTGGAARDGRRWLLQDVSGCVEPGQVVAVVGPSGSGKSTLLSLCNLMRTPSTGQLYVADVEVRRWVPHELRRTVAMVFQQPVMLPGTVRDNLEAGPRLCGRRSPDCAQLLESLGLSPDLADQPAETLSGGQRQRVALARALALGPRVLLLDEVTSALDSAAMQAVEAAVAAWRRACGGTVLWVTHDLDQARRVSDQTWVVMDGRVVEQGATETVITAPKSEAVRRFLQTGAGSGAASGARAGEEAQG